MKGVWASSIAKAGCMREAFAFKELVKTRATRFDVKHKMIGVKDSRKASVPFTPNVFRMMLQLPLPNKFLKLSKVDAFLDAYGSGLNLLREFMVHPFDSLENLR